MAGIFQRMLGAIGSFFQFGGPTGPGINANGAALETKNSTNSAFAVHRGADPVGDNDFVTRQWAETILFAKPIALQFNGGSALPANSATDQYYVVTTTGANATIGQLLWDDGSGVGTVQVIPARVGMTIVPETNFTGGTIVFTQNNLYIWNGTAWANTTPSVAGAEQTIRFAVGTGAAQTSVTSIPANAVVSSSFFTVTTPFSPGTTISVGQTGSVSLLQATTDIFPGVVDSYSAPQDTAWGAAALPVLVTITGAPAAGAGFITVVYSLPNG
ncbi:MAG: hypothetical protein ACHREM_00340 [Polyangiales bacterium]